MINGKSRSSLYANSILSMQTGSLGTTGLLTRYTLHPTPTPNTLTLKLARLGRRDWTLFPAFHSRLAQHFLDCAHTRQHRRSLDRHEDDFRVIRARHVAQTFDVASRDQVLRGIAVLFHDLGYARDGFGLSLGIAQARLRGAFSLQDCRFLFTFRPRDRRLFLTFRPRNRCLAI